MTTTISRLNLDGLYATVVHNFALSSLKFPYSCTASVSFCGDGAPYHSHRDVYMGPYARYQ
jgi:hypothetical protein